MSDSDSEDILVVMVDMVDMVEMVTAIIMELVGMAIQDSMDMAA